MLFQEWLAEVSDYDLVEWLAQYSGANAGFHPGMRRMRVAAEKEAKARDLNWKKARMFDYNALYFHHRYIQSHVIVPIAAF